MNRSVVVLVHRSVVVLVHRSVVVFVLTLAAACIPPDVSISGRACSEEHACVAGFVCIAGGCEPACNVDGDCNPGRVCRSGGCVVLANEGEGEGEGEDAGPRENDAPIVLPTSAVVPPDDSTSIPVDASDADGDALVLVVSVPPLHGTVTSASSDSVIYTPAPGFGGRDSFVIEATDGIATSAPATVDVEVISRSCAQILAAGGSAGNGVYTIDVDGVGSEAPQPHFCNMDALGGGWTLALKANGNLPTFAYDAPIWTDASVLAPDSTDLSLTEAKFPVFNSGAFDELLVEMSATGAAGVQQLRVDVAGPSLRAVFAANLFVPSSAGRLAWKALLPGSSMQPFCAREGLNAGLAPLSRVRIGLTNAFQVECIDVRSRIGVGGFGEDDPICNTPENSVGNTANNSCAGDNGTRDIRAFAWVYTKNRDLTSLPPARDCAAHRALGRVVSGRYRINDGVTATIVFCDQERLGGGWRQIAVVDARGACPNGLARVTADSITACGRATAGRGAVSLSFPSPVPYEETMVFARGFTDGLVEAFTVGGTIEDPYVDGLSFTVGAAGARRHLFTYAESRSSPGSCPCDGGQQPPSFVGTAYVCEQNGEPTVPYGPNAPTWQERALAGDCLATAELGVQTAELGATESGPIELRVMSGGIGNNDVAISRVEVYVR